jgi:SPP1 family predicted phage head-tail adaptor
MAAAGKRDQRIKFQAPTEIKGTMGGRETVWADAGSEVFAAVVPLSSREVLTLQQSQARAMYRITIPNRRDIVATLRVVWLTNGNKILVIRDASDPGQRPVERTLLCEEAGPDLTI